MTAPTIDRATFEALEDSTGAEFATELVDTFLQEAPVMLNDLRQALAVRDADRFRRAAHSLKSNCNTFGALPLAAMARDLELAGVVTVAERGTQPLAEFEAEFARAATALTAMRHG